MEEQVLEILTSINEDIADYDGENMFDDGLLDSLLVIDLISELTDAFDITISAKYIVEDNFKTKDAIVNLVKTLKN